MMLPALHVPGAAVVVVAGVVVVGGHPHMQVQMVYVGPAGREQRSPDPPLGQEAQSPKQACESAGDVVPAVGQ